MSRFVPVFKRFVKEESGATMVEYGLMVAVIAAVSVAVVRAIGNRTSTAFRRVEQGMR